MARTHLFPAPSRRAALLRQLPLLILAGVAGPGCTGTIVGGSTLADAGFDCASVAPATLSEIYGKSLAGSAATGCAASGCHGTGQGGLTFTSAESFYAATVGQPAASAPGLLRVQPGDPAGSVLYRRLAPDAAGRMPTGGPFLDAAALAEVAGWICAGAPPPGDAGAPDGGLPDAGPLALTSFSPTSGIVGASVTVFGVGFSPVAGEDVVRFNGVAAPVHGADGGALSTEVPAGATTGPLTVEVRGRSATSAASFQIIPSNPAPVLTSATPSTVVAGAGDTAVALAGTGFIAQSQVLLDGAGLATTWPDAGLLEVTLSASTLATGGAHQLTVSNPGPGGGTSNALAFAVANPAPALSGISPTTAATGGATFTLTATGTGFVGSSVVDFNGAAVPTTFVSATSLTAQIPSLSTAGSYPVTVVNPAPGGGTSNPLSLTAATVTTPVISGLSPSPAPAGAAFTLTITGANFSCAGPTTRVLFDSLSLSWASCTATQLTVAIPATAAGTSTVQVTGTNGGSNLASLSLVAPNPVPTLSALSPTSANAGSAGFTLSLTGTGFVQGAGVSFNGAARTTTFLSSMQLSAAVLASDLSAAGAYPVVVTNPAPGGGPSNALGFSVVTVNPAPSVTSLSPSNVLVGAGATTVTVTGAGFVASSTATFDGSARGTTLVSATQLSMALTASDTQTGGSYPVAVVTPAPGGGTSNAVQLTVGNPAPAISGLSPCGVVAGTGPVTLQISGSGFLSTSTVKFNGTAVTATSGSPTALSATIPSSLLSTAPADDAASVVVSNPAPGGGATSPFTFGVARAVSTLSGTVQPIFNGNCVTGCHSAVTAAGGLVLASGAAANLVGLASSACAGELRVTRCGPLRAQSVLVDKIKASVSSPACSGSPMPKTGSLTAAEQQAIVDWIAQGVPP